MRLELDRRRRIGALQPEQLLVYILAAEILVDFAAAGFGRADGKKEDKPEMFLPTQGPVLTEL